MFGPRSIFLDTSGSPYDCYPRPQRRLSRVFKGIFQSQRQQPCQIITVIQKTIHEEHNVIYKRIFKHVNLGTDRFQNVDFGGWKGLA